MAFEENNPSKALGTFQTDVHSHSMDCHGLSQVIMSFQDLQNGLN